MLGSFCCGFCWHRLCLFYSGAVNMWVYPTSRGCSQTLSPPLPLHQPLLPSRVAASPCPNGCSTPLVPINPGVHPDVLPASTISGGSGCFASPVAGWIPRGICIPLSPPRDLHPPRPAMPDAVPLKSAVHCNLAFYSRLRVAAGPCQERLQAAQNSSFHGGHPGKEQCSRSWDCGNFVFLPLRKQGAAGPARASPSPSLHPLLKIVLGMSFE